MYFRDRTDAGQRLAQMLSHYKGEEVIVYALPRGGVPVAAEIARSLGAPLELIFAHKIGHPYHPEYAIGALSETGRLLINPREAESIDPNWLEEEKERQLQEMARKRALYLRGEKELSCTGKIAIIVDDGIATGMTLMVGVLELKERHPKKLIVAVPVAPAGAVAVLRGVVNEVVVPELPQDEDFLGSVGAYYDHFPQVEDSEVIERMGRSD